MPHPVDEHVGARLRQLRKSIKLSQSALAEQLGLTFQQVQKYERGTNRISASKLHEAAMVLNVPIAAFFDGLPAGAPAGESASVDPAGESDLQRLIRLYEITPAADRRRLIDVVEAMARR
jgi:transcriptional regulator with XRE-family HTH domain